MTGVRTKCITAVEIHEPQASDQKQYRPRLTTAKQFHVTKYLAT